eukprot:6551880-Alexandrium_andersonii.AAC.1
MVDQEVAPSRLVLALSRTAAVCRDRAERANSRLLAQRAEATKAKLEDKSSGLAMAFRLLRGDMSVPAMFLKDSDGSTVAHPRDPNR